MVAETHSRYDDLDDAMVCDFLWAVVTEPGDDRETEPERLLSDLGIDGELDLMELWDLMAEEFGERTLGSLDADDLGDIRTVGDLAARFTRHVP